MWNSKKMSTQSLTTTTAWNNTKHMVALGSLVFSNRLRSLKLGYKHWPTKENTGCTKPLHDIMLSSYGVILEKRELMMRICATGEGGGEWKFWNGRKSPLQQPLKLIWLIAFRKARSFEKFHLIRNQQYFALVAWCREIVFIRLNTNV